jgi:membrane protease YdiL (CAAX protease family)
VDSHFPDPETDDSSRDEDPPAGPPAGPDPGLHFPSPRRLVLLAIACEGGVGVAAVILGWLLGCPPLETIRWTAAELAHGAAAALPMAGIMGLCIWVPWGPLRNLVQVVDELLVPMFRDCRLLELALISALAGVGEEMLFRGVIQQAVADWVGGSAGPWIGLAVAAALFGLLHWITPTYAALAALMSVYLGWLWIDTENLLVPILAHAVYDFLALVYLAKIRPPRTRAEKP